MIRLHYLFPVAAVVALASGCGQDAAPSSKTEPAQPRKAAPTPSAEDVKASAKVVTAAPVEAGKRPPISRDALVNTFHAALDGIVLTDDQKEQIDALHNGGDDGDRTAYYEAKQTLYRALAGAVEAGPVEPGAVERELDAVKTAKAAKHNARMKMVSDYHGILTPEQRQKVAQSARSLLDHDRRGDAPGHRGCPYAGTGGPGHGCPHANHGDCPCANGGDCPCAKGGECPCANGGDCPHKGAKAHGGCSHAEAEAGGCPHAEGKAGGCPHAEGKAGGCPHAEAKAGGCPYAEAKAGGCPYAEAKAGGCPHKKGLGWLLDGITLTADQQKQVDALEAEQGPRGPRGDGLKSKEEAAHQHLLSLFDAFEKEPLDPAVLEARGPGAEKTMAHLERKVGHISALSKILDDTQRKALAVTLNEKAERLAEKIDQSKQISQ